MFLFKYIITRPACCLNIEAQWHIGTFKNLYSLEKGWREVRHKMTSEGESMRWIHLAWTVMKSPWNTSCMTLNSHAPFQLYHLVCFLDNSSCLIQITAYLRRHAPPNNIFFFIAKITVLRKCMFLFILMHNR